jgi:tetratricopeptide (TPR) repeat protein
VASYAGEIEDAKEEVRNNPDDAKAHYNLGTVYSESGMYKKAIEFKETV